MTYYRSNVIIICRTIVLLVSAVILEVVGSPLFNRIVIYAEKLLCHDYNIKMTHYFHHERMYKQIYILSYYYSKSCNN